MYEEHSQGSHFRRSRSADALRADCAGCDFVRVAAQVIHGGLDRIQLHEKQVGPDEFLCKAERLLAMAQALWGLLIRTDNRGSIFERALLQIAGCPQ